MGGGGWARDATTVHPHKVDFKGYYIDLQLPLQLALSSPDSSQKNNGENPQHDGVYC